MIIVGIITRVNSTVTPMITANVATTCSRGDGLEGSYIKPSSIAKTEHTLSYVKLTLY